MLVSYLNCQLDSYQFIYLLKHARRALFAVFQKSHKSDFIKLLNCLVT